MEQISDDLKRYLNKLVKTIETQASFKLGNTYILNKTRIDDIICCIDVNFPKALKLFKKHGEYDRHVQSFNLYDKLIVNIKTKMPLIGKVNYSINYSEVVSTVQDLMQSIPQDTAYIEKTYPYLFNDEY